MALVGPQTGDVSSGDEDEEDEGEEQIEDSQILEDLPDETEVRPHTDSVCLCTYLAIRT